MKRLFELLRNENIIAAALVLTTFCIYLATMCRSVGFTDSGELAAVVCTLGIAHPTGYPLFTLLGRIWVMVSLPVEIIIQLNIFSALLTAVAVGIFFKTTLALRHSSIVFLSRVRKQIAVYDNRFLVASAIASLILGFSTTFWSQSTAVEVYSLHLVMILLATLFFIEGMQESMASPEERMDKSHLLSPKLILSAFVLGLSFSNHMTTILLAPGFVWLYFRTFGLKRESFLNIFKIVPFFFLGLSIYLYLPIRSAGNPMFDWGHPATVERFFWHISGKQFRVWMFSGWDVVQKQLNYYVSNFFSEFNFIFLIFIVAGIITVLKQSRRLLIFLTLMFITTVAYAVNYDIFDIGSYFLLSYLVVGWIIAYGIYFLLNWIKERRVWVGIVIVTILLAAPIMQGMYNWEAVDETHNMLPEQFVKKAFSDLEPNAVVLATMWDYFVSPSFYYQYILDERRDVIVIDKSLLQNRSWYFMQLERQAPWLMERIRPSVKLFLMELYKFEHELPFNFNIIQTHWQNLLKEIVEKSIHDHPVYLDARIDKEFPSQYRRIPAGLFLRLQNTEDTVHYRTALAPFSAWDRHKAVSKDFEQYYVGMLLRDADWSMKQGELSHAKGILEEILRIEPGNYTAIWLMKRIGGVHNFSKER